MAELPRLPGFTVLHQHDTNQYCSEYEAEFPNDKKCSYVPSIWTRIKMWFWR